MMIYFPSLEFYKERNKLIPSISWISNAMKFFEEEKSNSRWIFIEIRWRSSTCVNNPRMHTDRSDQAKNNVWEALRNIDRLSWMTVLIFNSIHRYTVEYHALMLVTLPRFTCGGCMDNVSKICKLLMKSIHVLLLDRYPSNVRLIYAWTKRGGCLR